MSEETVTGRARFAWLVAAICGLLTVPRLLLHELWRDEAWLWLVVTESASVNHLFEPLARSGQGYLFPLLCFFAGQVWTSWRAMQFVHLVLVCVAAFVFARWSPFGRLERSLFVLGYFLFYEYAVLSRHYVAGVLLVWLACVATRSRRPALALGVVLGLLCQTTVYGYILALAIACGWLLDRCLRRHEVAPLPRAEVAAGAVLALTGAVAGLAQLIPKAGTSFATVWQFGWNPVHARSVLSMPWRVFVPLPRPAIQFWNTNLLDAWPTLQAIAGALTLALAAALLWRRKVALVTFCIGAAGFMVFGYIKYLGVLRHQGHLWLLFAAALWLGGGPGFDDARQSWHRRALLVLLIIHAGVGAFASWVDLRHPFSNGAATAELIRSKGWDQHPLLGHREPPAATIALFLGRPLYSPSRKIFVTHPDWGPLQREMISATELRCAARELAAREAKDIVLVMNWELPQWEELDPLGAVVGAIQSTEDYYLYQLRYGRLASTAQAAECGQFSPSAASPGPSP